MTSYVLLLQQNFLAKANYEIMISSCHKFKSICKMYTPIMSQLVVISSCQQIIVCTKNPPPMLHRPQSVCQIMFLFLLSKMKVIYCNVACSSSTIYCTKHSANVLHVACMWRRHIDSVNTGQIIYVYYLCIQQYVYSTYMYIICTVFTGENVHSYAVFNELVT